MGPLLAGALACLACDPLDEGPPPYTPPGVPAVAEEAPAPPAEEPASGEAAASTDDGDGTRYASDEITIGQETDGYDDDDPSALTDFRAALDPHGTWVNDPTYGTVWVPSTREVGADFQPYVSAGHWVYDSDWAWASDYGWGWAPFHYGRWVHIQGRGWAWIPGRAYRGAWVSWGVDDGYTYLGWAPLGPAFLWFGGAPIGFGGYYAAPWVYCPRGYVFAPSVGGHVVSGAAAGSVASRVRPFVTAHPTVAGPSPQSMGYRADQVPAARGADSAEIARAQAFARPATAEPLGARAPTRMAPAARSPAARSLALPPARVIAPRPIGGGVPTRLPATVSPRPAVPFAGASVPMMRGGGVASPRPAVQSATRVAPASPSPRVLRAPAIRGGGVRVR
jgi:hypothetical protein